MLSVLLGSHPPEMPVGALVDFTSLFGIAAGTTRTALSRMVASGELDSADGRYRLGPRLLRRQAEQDAGRAAPSPDWDGTWWFVIVTADRRPVGVRRHFRDRMIGARLGELRPDTWLRSANVGIPGDLDDAVVTRGPLVGGDERELAATLWDLDRLGGDTAMYLDEVSAIATRLVDASDGALADAFVRLAAVQRFLRTEPQLPERLHRSQGDELRRRYDAAVERYQGELRRFLRRRADGPVDAQ